MQSRPGTVRVWRLLRSRVPGEDTRARLLNLVNALFFVLALLAILSLIAEYGFYLTADVALATRTATRVVLYGYVVLGIAKILLTDERAAFLRTRWLDQLLLLLILLYLILPGTIERLLLSLNPLLTPESLTRVYVVLAQLFSLLAFIPVALRFSRRIMAGNIQPSVLILGSFLFLIILGTALLLLPRATVSGSMPLVDALFTATSAVCVTGLIVVDTATYFTPLGHAIILVLMQAGGLGIMTLTTFFAYILGSGANLKEYTTMQTLLGEESVGRIRQTIVTITLTTIVLEAFGALAIFEASGGIPAAEGRRVFFAVFHAVSGFCNAGFTLTTHNLAEKGLVDNAGFQAVIMMLVVLGGLGFPVLSNLGASFMQRAGSVQARLSLHTKIVLVTTGALLLLGTAGIFLLEADGEISIVEALFHSVSARTAGFNTVDIGSLAPATLFLLVFLMWIGASPGSTGGGVKTTTAALAFLNIRAIASGRNRVEVFGKQVASSAIVRAFSTALLSFGFIATAVFILLLSERQNFLDLLFEVVSAMSTVGLSTGVTPTLSIVGKIIIILSMFFGRVGLLAVVVAFTRRREEGSYEYVPENVLVT